MSVVDELDADLDAQENRERAICDAGESLTIKNIGPIPELSIQVPKNGGLVVFKGKNGQGKTTAIEAVEASLGKKGNKLEKQKGALKSGTVETPWGTRISIGQVARFSGELSVSTLDDEFSIADLVDPKEKDDVAADRRRSKALLRVAKAEAKPELFYGVVDDRSLFDEVVAPESIGGDDVVQMASKIKRDFEAASRLKEQQSEHYTSEAVAIQKSLEGVAVDFVYDMEDLRQRHEAAVAFLSEQRLAIKKYNDAVYQSGILQQKIAHLESAEKCDFNDLKRIANNAVQQEKDLNIEVEGIRQRIIALEARKIEINGLLDAGRSKYEWAVAKIAQGESDAQVLADLRERVRQYDTVTEVNAEHIAQAEDAVENARNLLTDAEICERAKSRMQSLAECRDKAVKYKRQSEQLRDSAKYTERILSDLIGQLGTPIEVDFDDKGSARLIVNHPKWGRTYFSKLSKGEKLSMVARIAIKAAGNGGVFTIPQEFYEGLDPDNRELLAAELTGSGVVAITAECSSGELRSEVLTSNN